jgi:hypothetical protein
VTDVATVSGLRRAIAAASVASKSFGVGVRLPPVPRALDPVEVLEAGLALLVQAAREVHEALGGLHEGREQVGRERVDGQGARVPTLRRVAARLAEADARVVDDRVERAHRVGVLGQPPHLRRAGQIRDEDVGEARQLAAQRVGLLGAARVADDPVAVVDEATGGIAAEAVVGAGDVDARHGVDHAPVVSTTRKRAAGAASRTSRRLLTV